MDIKKIGNFIKTIRKNNKMTQSELAERLSISPQAISRWENGEALPDTLILLELSKCLRISVDTILNAGYTDKKTTVKKKFNVLDVPKGFEAIESVKTYFGDKSLFYIGMMDGISKLMNFNFEEALMKNKNILYKEVIISALHQGYYIDKEEVEILFKDNYKTYEFLQTYNNEYWKKMYEANLDKISKI